MPTSQNTNVGSPIDFRTGYYEDFKELIESNESVNIDGNIYHIIREVDPGDGSQKVNLNDIYIGGDLVGDTYHSKYLDDISKRVTNPIGLIPYGMTVGELMKETGGSLSKLIDMMLFTGASPSIDECAIICGFIPSVDVQYNWTDEETIARWIQDNTREQFTNTGYRMFFDLEGTIDTMFSIVLDPSKSIEEYGEDRGMYSGRMFIAVPYDDSYSGSSSQDSAKDISVIVDKVFSKTYSGEGLSANFISSQITLRFGSVDYGYKLYMFNSLQNVISRINMEYYIELS